MKKYIISSALAILLALAVAMPVAAQNFVPGLTVSDGVYLAGRTNIRMFHEDGSVAESRIRNVEVLLANADTGVGVAYIPTCEVSLWFSLEESPDVTFQNSYDTWAVVGEWLDLRGRPTFIFRAYLEVGEGDGAIYEVSFVGSVLMNRRSSEPTRIRGNLNFYYYGYEDIAGPVSLTAGSGRVTFRIVEYEGLV